MAGPHHILVVDDEPEICSLLADYLGHAGFAVSTAEDGAAMRRTLEEEPVDRVGAHPPADVVGGLEQRDAHPVAAEQARAGQAREAAAHDAHVGSGGHRRQSRAACGGVVTPGCGAAGGRW